MYSILIFLGPKIDRWRALYWSFSSIAYVMHGGATDRQGSVSAGGAICSQIDTPR